MPYQVHRNNERGHVRHGWLQSAHSFSFARYYNPERMNFGALLVINEDVIAPGAGFGEHAHDNMEIITIPLQGSLAHGDSMGNSSVIRAGDIQIMSAGTGISHSEQNASESDPVHLLQIWIMPNVQGLPTRYEELHLDEVRMQNTFHFAVSPTSQPDALTIRQNAWLALGRFDAQQTFTVTMHNATHGLYLLVISGKIQVGNDILSAGDALAVTNEQAVLGVILEPAHLLTIEVPMTA